MEDTSRAVVAFYDSEKCPLTYDFCHFAAMARGYAGKRPLHFVFVPKTDGTWSKPGKFDAGEEDFRQKHLVWPLVPLFDATYTVCLSRDHAKQYEALGESYPEGYRVDAPVFAFKIEEAVKRPTTPPKPSVEALAYVQQWLSQFSKPVVCVTLRTSRYPTRNSTIPAWVEYACKRDDLDWVFIPDTGTAGLPGWGDFPFKTYVPASFDQDLRLAMYHSVKFNCFTSNGCGALVWFGDKPYAFFKSACDGYKTKEQWAAEGIPFGTQPPWVRQNQRWVWEDDTIENIGRTFKELGH